MTTPPVTPTGAASTTAPAKPLRNGLVIMEDDRPRKAELLHLAAIIAGGLAAQHSMNTDGSARIASRALDIAEALIAQVQKR